MCDEYYKIELVKKLTSVVGNYLTCQNYDEGIIGRIISDVLRNNRLNVEVLRDDEKWLLFKRIIEDTQLNINSLISTNENNDNFRYVDIKRNARSIIEAFIDMVNLFYDDEYIEIIKFNCNRGDADKEKIRNKLDKINVEWNNSFINVRRKIELANQCEAFKVLGVEEFYPELIKYLNKYSHPNIFIQNSNEQSNCKSLYSTLWISLQCLDLSFCLFIVHIWRDLVKNENKNVMEENCNELNGLMQNCCGFLEKWLKYSTI